MGLFGPSRKEFQRVQDALAQARAEGQQLGQRLAQAEAQRDAVEAARRQESERLAAAESERDALYEERDVLRVERDIAAEERDNLQAERDAWAEERDGLRAERDALAGERGSLRTELDGARAAADDLRRQLANDRRGETQAESNATAETAETGSRPVTSAGAAEGADPDGGRSTGHHAADEAVRIGAAGAEAGAGRAVNGSWTLVLADLERRWAAGTGALPTMRGVSDGPVSAQLAEGLTREVERLREEMGVDVSLITGQPLEPADPVVFLLAATDLLGALAATCERVTVTLDETLVLTGEVWVELGDDLDVSRSRALAAGALIDPIDVNEDRVLVTLRP